MARKFAFAFQNLEYPQVDTGEILQRKFFSELNLPEGLIDKEILDSLIFSADTPIADAENKLNQLENIADFLGKYEKRILKHLQKLQRIDGHETQGATIFLYESRGKGKLSELINSYNIIFDYVDFFLNIIASEMILKMREIMKEIYRNAFGKKLKNIRRAKGLTQKRLAERLGISQSGVVMYERGEREPSLGTLHNIARILEVPATELLA